MNAVTDGFDAMNVSGFELAVQTLTVRGTKSALKARVYRIVGVGVSTEHDTLVVYFHGGGFVSGGLDEADQLLRQLIWCNPGCVVLASKYTLATTKPFPEAVEDAYAILLWTGQHKTKLGWSGKHLVVMGIEAGANLAAVGALMARDRIGPKLVGQILIQPMLDLTLPTNRLRQMNQWPYREEVTNECAAYLTYLPHAADRAHPYASPLRSTRLENLPPALILSAEGDTLRDEAEQYGAKLISAGVRTTVRRMPNAAPKDFDGHNVCASKVIALAEVAIFINGLDR